MTLHRRLSVRSGARKRILGRPDIIQSRIFNLPRKEPRVRWWMQREAIRDWLESLPKPVGIFAYYDARGQ